MGSDTQTFYLPWKAPLLNFYRESVTWMKLTLGGGYFQNTAQHRHFQGRRNNTNFHTTAQKWSFNLTFPRRGFALSAQHNWNKTINTSSSLSEIQRWITLRSYLRLSPTLPLHLPPPPLPHSSSSSSPADRSCLHRSLNARAPPHASLFGVPVACDSGKIALLRRVLCCSDGNLPPLTSVVLLIRQKEQMHSPTTRTMNLTVLFLLSLSCTVFLTDTSGKTIPNFSS